METFGPIMTRTATGESKIRKTITPKDLSGHAVARVEKNPDAEWAGITSLHQDLPRRKKEVAMHTMQ